VWTTDSNGNYLSNTPVLAGTSYALESYELIFNQDLNGDGVIGVTQTAIQTDTNSFGSTTLTEVAGQYYYLDNSNGSGPAFKYEGTNVSVGEFGSWTPIGAVQTASGYDVVLQDGSNKLFQVWTTDSNGNYLSNTPVLAGTSYALESYELIFNQDLNGDGVIGLYAQPGTILQIGNTLSGASVAAAIGVGATLDVAAADSASVTFSGSTGMLKLDSPSTFSGEIFNFRGNGTLSGSDQIDLMGIDYNSVHDSYANGVLTVMDGGGDIAKLSFDGSYTLANFDFASDGSGGTIVYDPPVPSSSAQSASLPFAANIALMGNYMASSFTTCGDNHGGTMHVAEAMQASDQQALSSPHHA
jgi:tryptophan-rich protein